MYPFPSAGNWEKLDYCSRETRHAIYDIHTGDGYHGTLDREHIGAIINTDGIQPFKSVHLPGVSGLCWSPTGHQNVERYVTGSEKTRHIGQSMKI